MKELKMWTADELYGACVTARDFEYNNNIFPLIGRELERPVSSVKAAIKRVRRGESCFQYNPLKHDKRFLSFLDVDATVLEIDFPEEEVLKTYPLKNQIKKRAMLEAMAEYLGDVSQSCRIVNISRQTYYAWLKDDAEFKSKINYISEMEIPPKKRKVTPVPKSQTTSVSLVKKHSGFSFSLCWGLIKITK